MRTSLFSAMGLLIAASIAGCPDDSGRGGPGEAGAAAEGGSGGEGGSQTLPAKVEIVRDTLGVPHVFGESEAAAFYGLGYATAQDRLFQMDVHRRYMRGRLAETFGGPDVDALIAHDTRMRTLGYARHAERVLAHPDFPAETRALLEAYAAGVNAYLASEGFSLPAIFAEHDIASFDPWQPADSLLVWDRIGERFNGIKIDNEIKLQKACAAGSCETPLCPGPIPIDEAAAVVPPSDSWPPSGATACFDAPDRDTSPEYFKASHGWVVHGDKSASGQPILALDPKLELTAPSLFYSFHLSTPSYTARGLGLAGAPAFLLFWNERVGQTVTAGGTDISDLFQLELSGAGYLVDGEEEAFVEVDEIIAVKGQAPITLPVRESRFGPVVTGLAGEPAPSGAAYALRHVELANESSHSLVGAMEMMGAHDMHSYREALGKWRLPAANSIFAALDDDDPAGHIGYHVIGAIPWRAPNLVGGRDYAGSLPYDGSDSTNDWSGILSVDERPHVIDPPQGYLFTANHLAVGTWYDDYAYTGLTGGGDTFRSLELRHQLAAHFADHDSMSMQQVHALHFVPSFEPGRIYHDILAYLAGAGHIAPPSDPAAAATTPAEKAGKAWQAFAQWLANGGELRHSNPQAPLVNRVLAELPYTIRPQVNPAVGCSFGGGEGGATFFLKSFDADPAGTMSDPAVVAFVIADAAAAWDEISAHLGNDPSAWRAPEQTPTSTVLYQYNQFCPTAMGSKCSLDPAHDIAAPLDAAFGNSILSSFGSLGTSTVDFSDAGGAVSLMPFGASEDPAAASFQSGYDAWLAADLGDPASTPAAPLDRADIEALSTIALSYE